MSAWIQHVKDFQAKHGVSYKDALKGASASYRSMKGSGNMRDLHSAISSKKARKYMSRGPNLARSNDTDFNTGIGYGVGRRKKYTKWVSALGAKDMIDAGFSKGASTISGSGVGRRKKYTKWVDALGAKDMIDAGFSKGTSTISGMGVPKNDFAVAVMPTPTKRQALASLQMANAMYGDQGMTQLKKHRKKLSGMALYAAGY